MEATVRSAREGDAAVVADLAGQLGYPTPPEKVAARLAPILADPDQAFLVAEAPGGRVVGWIHVFLVRLVEAEPFGDLGGFVVDEAHRGRGLGRALLAACESWVRDRGVGRLRIRTRSDRADAHAFYRGRGYSLVKRQHVFDRDLA